MDGDGDLETGRRGRYYFFHSIGHYLVQRESFIGRWKEMEIRREEERRIFPLLLFPIGTILHQRKDLC